MITDSADTTVPATDSAAPEATPQNSVAAAIAAYADGSLTVTPEEETPEETDSEESPSTEESSEQADSEPAEGDNPSTEESEESEESAEEEGETEEEGDEDEFVLSLPGRRAGDPEEEIALAGLTPAQQERMRQLRNGFMRGEQVRAEEARLRSMEGELEQIGAEITADPAQFLLSKVKPEFRRAAVLEVLADLMAQEDSTEYDEIVETLNRYEQDPRERELDTLKRERDRLARQRETTPAPEQVAQQENVAAITNFVERCVSDDVEQDVASDFRRDAYAAITAHIQRHNLTHLPPEQVQQIIAPYLRGYGLKAPRGAATRPSTAPTPTRKSAVTTQQARETGNKLVQASARRKEVASVPAGAGSAAATLTPPPGQTVTERLKWYAAQK